MVQNTFTTLILKLLEQLCFAPILNILMVHKVIVQHVVPIASTSMKKSSYAMSLTINILQNM